MTDNEAESSHGAPDEPASVQRPTGRVEFLFAVRQYHHSAIWEEQKHFTWIVSVLLSLQVLLVNSTGVDAVLRNGLSVAGSLIGFACSITALRVQRHEGRYFANANRAFVRQFNLDFPEDRISAPSPIPNKPLYRLPIAFVRGECGVRDYFQILFLTFACVFSVLFVAVVLWWMS